MIRKNAGQQGVLSQSIQLMRADLRTGIRMTANQTQYIRQQILVLRGQLAKLETQRASPVQQDDTDIWERFLKLSNDLSQFEQMLIKINESTTQDIHDCREKIMANLEEYNRISTGMREMEKFFLVNVLRPSYTLKQATRKREYLEKEYTRIRSGIINHEFGTLQEVQAEIRNTLVHSDKAYEPDQRNYEDEQVETVSLWEIVESLDPQDMVEDIDEDQITADFKRFVLPATHPDTSDTPKEIFLTVMGTFKALDYLLMEAYVAQYRGEIEPDPEEDILHINDELSQRQQDYHRLQARMDRRLKAIKKELDPIEIDQPEKVKENILKLREEIKGNIQRETEKIIDLREKIQGLTDLFIQLKRRDDE
jgi:hypothetical protein